MVLGLVEVEDLPPGTQLGPGGDSVARDQEALLGPVEREVARRVARSVQNLQRAERVAVGERFVDRHGIVLREAERQPELERDQPQRLVREDRHGLRATVSGDPT